MAGHAGFRWRNTREAGGLHCGMTITAIDVVTGYVSVMTEWNRLVFSDVHIGYYWRPIQTRGDTHEDYCRRGTTEHDPLDDPIGTGRKKLTHGYALSF